VNAHYFRRLIYIQATKETQLDYARFAGIKFRETVECFIQRYQIGGLLFSDLRRLVKGDSLSAAAPLLVLLLARIVNQDPPHQFSANPKELCAILPIRPFLIDQPNVRFVNQSGRLQSVIGALAAHVVMRQSMQFRINHGN
jgi:hypothetical protein